MRAFFIATAVFLAVLAFDQATKVWVERAFALGESVEVFPVFALTYVRNQGAAWGLFQGAHLWLAGFGAVAVAGCCLFWRRIFGPHAWAPPLGGLLLAGIVGNLIDRVRLGYVVDFLDFHWGDAHFPCFNVADSAICVAVVALIVLQTWADRRARAAGAPAPEEPAP